MTAEPKPAELTVFVSLFCYALHKQAGIAGAHAAIADQVEQGVNATWPGFRALARLRTLANCAVMFEGSTLIAKARSRASGAFLSTQCDLWVSIDDDVETTLEGLTALLEASQHGIAAMPYWLRNGSQVACDLKTVEHAPSGLHAATDMALGLAAFPRECIVRMYNAHPELMFAHGTQQCCALFLESVKDFRWIGEDNAFCARARACDVPLWVVCDQETFHDGRPYALSFDRVDRNVAPVK